MRMLSGARSVIYLSSGGCGTHMGALAPETFFFIVFWFLQKLGSERGVLHADSGCGRGKPRQNGHASCIGQKGKRKRQAFVYIHQADGRIKKKGTRQSGVSQSCGKCGGGAKSCELCAGYGRGGGGGMGKWWRWQVVAGLFPLPSLLLSPESADRHPRQCYWKCLISVEIRSQSVGRREQRLKSRCR